MFDRLLSEHWTAFGTWFLEASSGVQVLGALEWKDAKGTMQLKSPLASEHENGSRYQYVHGLTLEQQAITVLDMLRLGGRLHLTKEGLESDEKGVSSQVVVGAHVVDDTEYEEISFRIPGLSTWLSKPLVEKQIPYSTEEGMAQNVTFFARREDAHVISGSELQVGFGTIWEHQYDQFSMQKSVPHGVLRLAPDLPKPLDWLLERITGVNDFLVLCAASPMGPDSMSIKRGEQDLDLLVGWSNARYCTHKSHEEFFMPRDALGVDLCDVLTRWFDIYPKLFLPCRLAVSALCSTDMMLHARFTSLMQALEGVQTAAARFDETIAAHQKSRTEKRVQSGGRKAVIFKDRLGALVDYLSPDIRKVILGASAEIPEAWINTRNLYTHFDELKKTKKEMLDGAGMAYAIPRLEVLLRILYLSLANVPQSAIESALSNQSPASRYLRQLNGEAV